MNPRKLLFTVAAAVALVATACGGTPTTSTGNETGTLTVWLMNGSAPQSVVDGVNADFKAKHPNVTVNVEIQQWSDVTTKLDTAFAGRQRAPGHHGARQYAGRQVRCGRRAPGHLIQEERLRELGDVAPVAYRLVHVPEEALLRSVLRGQPRGHLPHRPVLGRRRPAADQHGPADDRWPDTHDQVRV